MLQAFQEPTQLPVGEHFRGVVHSKSDFVFTPVEKIISRNVYVRKVSEKLMINRFGLISNGFNKRL